jgi:hypothetical protein
MKTGYYMFKGTSTPVGKGTSYSQLIIGGMSDYEVRWGPSQGISVNDPTKQNINIVQVGLGEVLCVRTRSGSSWQMAGLITLQAMDQTLRV